MTTATKAPTAHPHDAALSRREREAEADIAAAFQLVAAAIVRGVTADNAQEIAARLQRDATWQPLRDTLVRVLTAAAEWGVDIARADLERRVLGVKDVREMLLGVAWDLANDDAARWALDYGTQLVGRLAMTTTPRIQRLISDWITNGEPLYKLVDDIRGGYLYSAERARTIAVTEVTRAYAEGNMAAWKRSGVIERHQWSTAVDELVCPICGPVHGKIVAIGESFGMVGTSPPAHPRCRCWLVPVTEYSEVDPVGLEQFGL